VFDSLLDDGAGPADHRVRFEHPCLSIEVHVLADMDGSTLTGIVCPATPQRVELQSDSSEVRLVAPVIDGAFLFKNVRPGPVRLHLSNSPNSASTHTDWFRI
jgi:hypothetical protein